MEGEYEATDFLGIEVFFEFAGELEGGVFGRVRVDHEELQN